MDLALYLTQCMLLYGALRNMWFYNTKCMHREWSILFKCYNDVILEDTPLNLSLFSG